MARVLNNHDVIARSRHRLQKLCDWLTMLRQVLLLGCAGVSHQRERERRIGIDSAELAYLTVVSQGEISKREISHWHSRAVRHGAGNPDNLAIVRGISRLLRVGEGPQQNSGNENR